LLNAFVAEARSRGVRQIWVASYDFQAPGMYEKAGFKRMAEFEGWPEGHVNVVLLQNTMSRNARCRFGVKSAVLTVHRSLPVYPPSADIFGDRRHVSKVP